MPQPPSTEAQKLLAASIFRFILVFLFFAALPFLLEYLFPALKISKTLVLSGDLILLLAGLLSFYFYLRSIGEVKPFALVKYVYLAMFSKLVICLLPVIVYILWSGKKVDKAGLLLCASMYIVYSYTEISLLLKYNKQRTNAQAGSPT